MIISNSLEFIFVRVLKTGSTSAQAMLVESGILADNDLHTSYRNDINDTPVQSRNLPELTAKKIRDTSPYKIPRNILVKEELLPLYGHLTPTEIVRLGLLSEEQLMRYRIFGIIRDPVDRYLSGWFFARHLENKASDKKALIKHINEEKLPHTFLGKSQLDFFSYEGQPLPNTTAWRTKSLNDELSDFVLSNGGAIKTLHSHKSQYRPEWSKSNYSDWLASEHINAMKDLMSDDVDFYHKQKFTTRNCK